MEGTLHVIEQLGMAHKQALAVIAEQDALIRELKERLGEA